MVHAARHPTWSKQPARAHRLNARIGRRGSVRGSCRSKLPRMNGKVIVVTGASAGIGASLSHEVGARGASVVLVARREKELGEVAAR